MTSTWLTNRQGDWNLHKYQGIPIKGRVGERLVEGMGRGDCRSPGYLWEHGPVTAVPSCPSLTGHPCLGLAYIGITSFVHTTLLLILLGMLLKKSMWVQAGATATFCGQKLTHHLASSTLMPELPLTHLRQSSSLCVNASRDAELVASRHVLFQNAPY